jgi:hypothetical protein
MVQGPLLGSLDGSPLGGWPGSGSHDAPQYSPSPVCSIPGIPYYTLPVCSIHPGYPPRGCPKPPHPRYGGIWGYPWGTLQNPPNRAI